MKQEGRLVTLSKEASFSLDHKMAMGLMPIKIDAERKLRNSYYNALEVEQKTGTNYSL